MNKLLIIITHDKINYSIISIVVFSKILLRNPVYIWKITGLVGLTNEHKIDVKLFLKAVTSHAFIKAIISKAYEV